MMQAIDECIEKGILAEFLKVNRSKVMMELSQRRAYKLARDAWIESGMERMRPKLEAAEVQAAYERKTREAAEVQAAYERKTREAAEVQAANERKSREAAEVQAVNERKSREVAEVQAANERKKREGAEKRAQDLEAELNLLRQQMNHKCVFS